eukprot:Skav221227  [mRNA]  locus=scaffold2467:333280:339015:+ [translate_table: standard]
MLAPEQPATPAPSAQETGSSQAHSFHDCVQAAASAPPAVCLRLQDLVEPPAEEPDLVEYKTVQFPGIAELATKLMHPGSELRYELPKDVDIHSALLDALVWSETRPSDGSEVHSIEIYTDGSSKWDAGTGTRVAAWAFVVVLRHTDGHARIQGWNSASVAPSEHGHVMPIPLCRSGQQHPDAYAAESEALARAIIWAFGSGHAHAATSFVFVSDALSMLNASTAQWQGLPRPFVTQVLRPYLFEAFRQITNVRGIWQKGHAGCLFNEVVDRLAQWQVDCAPFAPQPFPVTAEECSLLPWLWLHIGASVGHYPCMVAGDALGFAKPADQTGADLALWPQSCPLPETTLQIEATLVTYNVNTLREWVQPSSQSQSWNSRTQVLQMQARNVAIVCLQETRTRHTKEWSTANWFGFSGKAEAGQGGVEVWCNRMVPFLHVGSKPVFLTPSACSVLVADARMVLVRFSDPSFQCIFGSLHAPHEHADADVKTAWWDKLAVTLGPYKAWPCLIGIDANARIGSEQDLAIGDFRMDSENDNGRRLHAFVLDFGLCVPSTFSDVVWTSPEDYGTWASPSGWVRIDFVLVPQGWRAAAFTMAIDDICLDTQHDDHRSVSCRMQVQLLDCAQCSRPQNQQPFDKHAMRTLSGQQWSAAFLQELSRAVRPLAWQCPSDQYAVVLNQAVRFHLAAQFPVHKKKRRSDWLSDQTWELLLWSRSRRRASQQVKQHVRQGMLREIMRQWTQYARTEAAKHCVEHQLSLKSWRHVVVCSPVDVLASQEWLHHASLAMVWYEHCASGVRLKLRKSLRFDEAQLVTRLARQQQGTFENLDGNTLWATLRAKLPKWRRRFVNKPPRFTATQQQFEAHFARVEDAQTMSLHEVKQVVVAQNQRALKVCMTEELEPCDLPTLFEVECAVHHMRHGKSTAGSLTAELLKADPAAAAQLLYPFAVHACMFGQEPLSHKGGFLVPLWKGKGSVHATASFRAILIADVVPKILHHIVRRRLIAAVQPSLLPFQVGGLRKMTVLFASQMLSGLRDHSRLAKRSQAVLYLDIANAFYTAKKTTIVSNLLGLPAYDVDEGVAVSTLLEPSALAALPVSRPLHAWVQGILFGSWSQVKSAVLHESNTALMANQGTRPGDPVADLSFTVLMTQVMSQIQRDVGHLMDLPSLGVHASINTPILWVDDAAIYIESEGPEDLMPKVQMIAQACLHRFAERGLHLNLQKGKTEVMCRIEGRGAHAVIAQLRALPGQRLSLQDGGASIAVTSLYTHLGVKVSADMSIDHELNHRLVLAADSLKECRGLLANPAIALHYRVCLATSLVLSRLYFGAEIWPSLKPSQMHKLQAFVMKVNRAIMSMGNRVDTVHTTDQQVYVAAALPHAEILLRIARLRHVVKVYCDAPPSLRVVLESLEQKSATSWLHQVKADCHWMIQYNQWLERLGSPVDCWSDWQRIMTTQPVRWKRRLALTRKKAEQWHHMEAQLQDWEARLASIHVQYGAPSPVEPVPSPVLPFVCAECQKRFPCAKTLSVHSSRQHSGVARARLYMHDPTICGACLKDYNNTQKLRQHLQYKKNGCLNFLERVWQPMSVEQAFALVTVQQPKGVHRPALVQAYGPRLPTREQWGPVCTQHVLPDLEHPPVPTSAPIDDVVEIVDVDDDDVMEPPMAQVHKLPPEVSLYAGKYVVLYFYSGHSRPGDLGQCMAEPCETWSIARWRAILAGDGGPKPLRTAEKPWGLSFSGLRQLHQLEVANALIQTWLLFATLGTYLNHAWIMEHPAEPGLACAASIWRVHALLQLYGLGARRHLVLQGLYGAASAKPTHFATYNLSAFPETLQRWRDWKVSARAWKSLKGKDASGAWNTASAKAYPWRINMCIAESFYQRAIQLQGTGCTPTCKDVSRFHAIFEAIQKSAVFGTQMGPDYAG